MNHLTTGYGLDENGYIVSDVSEEKISPAYLPCIREAIKRLKGAFPHRLHSVYVYGSVPRGDAVIPHSDLDLIAMFDTELNSDQRAKLKKLAEELSEKYLSLVRDVGIAVAYYDYSTDPTNYYESAFLKELSVCVYGEDIGLQFGPYKLTPELAISFNGDIGESLIRAMKRLDTDSDDAFKLYVQNFSRKLIRTYYSMVMARSQVWTTRLDEQAEVVSKYLPNKTEAVQRLLKWVSEPPVERESVLKFFRKEGEWASLNFIKEARVRQKELE